MEICCKTSQKFPALFLDSIGYFESQKSLLKHTAEATGSSLSTVRRIVKQKDGPETPGKKKRPNKKEEVNKLDEFDLVL